jgi:hypothetical protein
MSARPYVVMEFTASSGNHCRMKVYKSDTLRPVIDVTWDDPQSDTDMNEADGFFAREISKQHPGIPVKTISLDIPDDQVRHDLITAQLRRTETPWNN